MDFLAHPLVSFVARPADVVVADEAVEAVAADVDDAGAAIRARKVLAVKLEQMILSILIRSPLIVGGKCSSLTSAPIAGHTLRLSPHFGHFSSCTVSRSEKNSCFSSRHSRRCSPLFHSDSRMRLWHR